MKKLSIFILVISILTVGAYATTYIGMGFTREMSGQQRDFINGRVTFGNILTMDVEGSFKIPNPDPTKWAQIYTYVNLSIPVSNFEIYAGFSPCLFFSYGDFSTQGFQTFGYLHAGVALKLQKLRIYGEALKVLYYSSFHFDDIVVASLGAQIGF